MNDKIVPFGKYKGQPIEILAQDGNYLEWLNGQGWVKDKYPQFYTVIINNFQEPSETPEHNALQALFLDDELCVRLVNAVGFYVTARVGKRVSRQFEVNGVDVSLIYNTWRLNHDATRWVSGVIQSYAVEIKPSLGDDFPAVLRQAMRMDAKERCAIDARERCVVYRDFVATGATEWQVKMMFNDSRVTLLSLDEVRQAPADIYPEMPPLSEIDDE